jgi:hypothetical protein
VTATVVNDDPAVPVAERPASEDYVLAQVASVATYVGTLPSEMLMTELPNAATALFTAWHAQAGEMHLSPESRLLALPPSSLQAAPARS